MARIAGVIVSDKKHVWVSLTEIYGIGVSRARKICQKTEVNPNVSLGTLTEEELDKLRQAVSEYSVEGDLRREVTMKIKTLMDIGCYRGLRHKRGLPVRGQRTRTNARTRKGVKKSGKISKK